MFDDDLLSMVAMSGLRHLAPLGPHATRASATARTSVLHDSDSSVAASPVVPAGAAQAGAARSRADLVLGYAMLRGSLCMMHGAIFKTAHSAELALHQDGVIALLNHDSDTPDSVLACTLNGDLHVKANDIGLFVSCYPNGRTAGRRLLRELRSGGIRGMSCMFRYESHVEYDRMLCERINVITWATVTEVTFVTAGQRERPGNPDAVCGLASQVAELGWGGYCFSDSSPGARAVASLKEVAWRFF
jgi:phage head maturation protease